MRCWVLGVEYIVWFNGLVVISVFFFVDFGGKLYFLKIYRFIESVGYFLFGDVGEDWE